MRGKSCQLLGLILGTCWFFTFLLHNQSLLLSTTFNPNGWQLDGIYILILVFFQIFAQGGGGGGGGGKMRLYGLLGEASTYSCAKHVAN